MATDCRWQSANAVLHCLIVHPMAPDTTQHRPTLPLTPAPATSVLRRLRRLSSPRHQALPAAHLTPGGVYLKRASSATGRSAIGAARPRSRPTAVWLIGDAAIVCLTYRQAIRRSDCHVDGRKRLVSTVDAAQKMTQLTRLCSAGKRGNSWPARDRKRRVSAGERKAVQSRRDRFLV